MIIAVRFRHPTLKWAMVVTPELVLSAFEEKKLYKYTRKFVKLTPFSNILDKFMTK